MFSKIIHLSIRNKVYVLIATILLLIAGVYNLTILPIDAVPDITNNQIVVITSSPSLAAGDVERFITIPIEQSIATIPGRIELRSFSRFGLSIVTIVFKDEIDIYWARQQVSEHLSEIQSSIPTSIGIPTLGPVTTGLGEIFQYTVVPKKGFEEKYSLQDLREIQDWIVRKNLLGTEGVADVSSFGGKVRQYQISLEQEKLSAFNITIQEIYDAISANNQNAGGAYIERGSNTYSIRTEGLLTNKEELGSIVIKHTKDGIPILIRDVASVTFGSAIRYGALVQNDLGEVAGGVVMMIKNGNSNQIIKKVKERIATIEKGLPEGIAIEPFLDRTKMVNASINTVSTNLIEGALIVIFILVLFLGNIRAGLIVASVIPLSMLFAVIAMNLFGVSGNLMSLGAIDFGLIVDGAVIIVEAVLHQIQFLIGRQKQTNHTVDTIVENANSKMISSAIFGQAIILIVYVPILTLVGIEGKMFKPMAQTVCFALIGACILSITYIPVMSSLFLKIPEFHKKNFSDRFIQFFEKIYRKTLFTSIRLSKFIITGTIIVFVISIYIFTTLGGEFIPTLEEGDFAVEFRILTGGSLQETIDASYKSMQLLKSRFPEIEKVVAKIGSGEIPTDPMPIEAADIMIILKPKNQWISATSFDELSEKMSHVLEEIPGVSFSFQYPVQMRFNELMTGAKQDIVVKIYGENLDSLEKYAQKVGNKIQTVQGATQLYVEQVEGLPQIVISFDRNALSRYGVSIESANTVVQTMLAGSTVGTLYEGERRFDIVLRMKDAISKNIEDIKNFYIPTMHGNTIPLSTIANVTIVSGPNQIQRDDTKRRIVIGFNVQGADVASVVAELQKKLPESVALPSGYFITYGGQFENLEHAKNRLLIAVPIALLLIFFLLYLAFKSIQNAILIFTAIPLSIIGGILALWIRSMPFSISAGIGFIALFGVAVLNGIVLISEIERRKSMIGASLVSSIIGGAISRIRPVLMTAAVASLGFIPMAFSTSSGSEVQRPLATVVIGGLVSSTLLTLLFLPLILLAIHQFRSKYINKFTAIIFLFSIVSPLVVNAQTQSTNSIRYVTEEEILEIVLANNLTHKQHLLEIEANKILEQSSADIPKTVVSSDLGQYNSSFFDTKFSIEQSFSFPTVYAKRKEMLEANTKVSQAEHQLNEETLKHETKQLFNEIQFLVAQQGIYLEIDSILNQMLLREEARLKFGTNDRTAYYQLTLLITQQTFSRTKNENFLRKAQIELMQKTNDGIMYLPTVTLTKRSFKTDSIVQFHPQIKIAQSRLEQIQSSKEVKNSQLLPDFHLSYANQSLKGWMTSNGGNDFYSDSWNRFNSVQLGLGFSIFMKADKATIESIQVGEAIATLEVKKTVDLLSNHQIRIINQLKLEEQLLQKFETSLVPESQKILAMFQKQYDNGAISYLEWSTNILSVLTTRLQYLETIRDFNRSVIEAEFYNLPLN